ncbi:MAG: tRNA1(Val) (adenine(37)-N6)-methyltransferase [Syntrophaceae bacterium]
MDRHDSLIHDDETVESLYGGRLRILQKKKGYRYTIDSVLLAHFVEPRKGERILELGAGSGVISLLLAFRNPGVRVTGLELQAELADMAKRSVSMNSLEGRVDIIPGDVRNAPDLLGARSQDVVVFNPPYRKMGSGKLNPGKEKALARHELAGSIADFLRAASYALEPGGRVCLIYPCSRMVEAIHRMRVEKMEPKRLRMVHSRLGAKGDFILVEGTKGGGEELAVLPPLFVYRGDEEYSEELEALFRDLSGAAG